MKSVAVVIPTYRARRSIVDVIRRIPEAVSKIYVVDDACPDRSGDLVDQEVTSPRVKVIRLEVNQGVGGATMVGYRAALTDGYDVIVKVDSDGQMAPEILFQIAEPVISGEADYSKGNRFWNVTDVRGMPIVRVIGNAGVSLLSKLSTGYWHIFDPANGYTALSKEALSTLPLDKIASRYFFESDMLFRLAIDHRTVADVPMKAVYGDEVSGLRVGHTLVHFFARYLKNFGKRLIIQYVLRDFNIASLAFLVAAITIPLGLIHGVWGFVSGWITGEPSGVGAVVLTALLLIVGYVSLMNFLAFDYSASRRR